MARVGDMVVVEQIGIALSDVVLFEYFIIGNRRTWTRRKEWWIKDMKMLDQSVSWLNSSLQRTPR